MMRAAWIVNRTFVRAYKKSLDVHEALAQNRSRFASRLNEMSEELVNLAKEGERLRKLVRGMAGTRTRREADSIWTCRNSIRITEHGMRGMCKRPRCIWRRSVSWNDSRLDLDAES
jgi:hypothetical protein